MAAGDSWGSVSVGGYGEKVYMSDVIKFIDKKELKKFRSFRALGDIRVYKQYWISVFKDGKPIPGKKGKDLQIPKLTTNFDWKTNTYDESKPCPYAVLAEKMNKHMGPKNQSYESATVIANFIDREMQEDLGDVKPPSKEEKKSGFRDIDSKHKNPVIAFSFSANEFNKIKGTMELNKIKLKSGEKTTKGPSDVKFGYDIDFKFVEEEKVASDKLKINKGERTPLTEEEQEYLVWDLDAAIASQVDSQKDAQKECDRIWAEFQKYLKVSGKGNTSSEEDSDDEPSDLDDEDEKPKKKKKSVDIDIDEDDEEDEKPKNKKKKARADDDEEEDEKPAKKKKKPVDDDDNDDDEDEKPVKKKKKIVDEDEDEKPAKKKKKTAVEDDDEDEKPAKKKKKVADDDDELDLDDLDEDDEDE